MSFNLSEWALKSRSVVIYLMIVAVAAGVFAFVKLGRNEDPAFVIKSMVVVAAWPGATMEDTLSQVTERLERQIEETPGLDFVRSFTTPGRTTIFVNLKQDVPAHAVQETWFKVRNLVADIRQTLPAGTIGPFFNDRFRRHLRHHLRLHRRWVQPGANCATMSRPPARGCCWSPTSRRSR